MLTRTGSRTTRRAPVVGMRARTACPHQRAEAVAVRRRRQTDHRVEQAAVFGYTSATPTSPRPFGDNSMKGLSPARAPATTEPTRPARARSPPRTGGAAHKIPRTFSANSATARRPRAPCPGGTTPRPLRSASRSSKPGRSSRNRPHAGYCSFPVELPPQEHLLLSRHRRVRWPRFAARVRVGSALPPRVEGRRESAPAYRTSERMRVRPRRLASCIEHISETAGI